MCGLLVAVVLAVGSVRGPGVPPDTAEMRLVARLGPATGDDALVAGDADRNGRPELYTYDWRAGRLVVFEHRFGNRFDTLYVPGAFSGPPWSLADADGDGRDELLTRYSAYPYYVGPALYKARDAGRFPDSLVWADSTALGLVPSLPCAIHDLDSDSLFEVSAPVGTGVGILEFARVLFEHRGENRYDSIATLVVEVGPDTFVSPTQQVCITDDLNGNGRSELCGGSLTGWLSIWESVADDSFVCVYAELVAPYSYVLGAAAGPDIDRDGRPEVFFSALTEEGLRLMMYEATGIGAFERAWQTPMPGGGMWSVSQLAVGDLDGDSVPELVAVGSHVLVYKCAGNDSFYLWWWHEAEGSAVTVHDINADGRNELIFEYDHGIEVWRYGAIGVEEHERQRLAAVSVEPSVVRVGEVVRLVGLPEAAVVTLLDVTGRVVRTVEVRGEHLATRGLGAGTYFLRVESGPHSVRHKLLLAN